MNIIQKLKSLLITGIKYFYPRIVSKEEYHTIKQIYALLLSEDKSCRNIGFTLMEVKFPYWYEFNERNLSYYRNTTSFKTYRGRRFNSVRYPDYGVFVYYESDSIRSENTSEILEYINKEEKLIVW